MTDYINLTISHSGSVVGAVSHMFHSQVNLPFSPE